MASKLNEIVRDAVRSRRLHGAFHARALLKIFAQLEGWDRAVEKRKVRTRKILIAGFIALFVSLFGLMILAGAAGIHELIVPLVCLFVLSAAAIFGSWRMRKQALAADLADELRTTILPVLLHLLNDLDPKVKIRVNLDLCTLNEEKMDESSQASSGGRRGTTTVNQFSEPLGSLRLPLANGNTMILQLRNHYKQAVRSYRSSSGKSKRKEKWKKTSKVTGIFIPNKPVAWGDRSMKSFVDPKQESLRFKDVGGVTTARIDRRFRFQKAGQQPSDVVPSADVMSILVRLAAMGHKGIQGAKGGR